MKFITIRELDSCMKHRDKYPTREVDPDNFLENEEINSMLDRTDEFTFTQEDWVKLLNCVHCNECETSEERARLNQKFLEDGNTIPGLEAMIHNFKKNGTPYHKNEMRITKPEGIPASSDTLFFMGCLSTIKIPRFTSNALEYLYQQGLDFTILDKEICCGYPLYVSGAMKEYRELQARNLDVFKDFKKMICLCPACFFVFTQDYPEMDIEYAFISDYLEPAKTEKSGSVGVQHLCQLKNRGYPNVAGNVDKILRNSGYDIEPVPHWCCGGGIGYMHRTDVIDKIAMKRMGDFTGDYMTTYCPGCYWIMKRFRKRAGTSARLKDVFALLMES